jgi:hypothetical protein
MICNGLLFIGSFILIFSLILSSVWLFCYIVLYSGMIFFLVLGQGKTRHMLMRVSVGIHKEDIECAVKTWHCFPSVFNAWTPRPQVLHHLQKKILILNFLYLFVILCDAVNCFFFICMNDDIVAFTGCRWT